MLENENLIDLLESLKEMSSEQLSQLIQDETAKDCPNDDLVLMALDVLEDREKEEPVKLGPKGKTAWNKYRSRVCSRQGKTVLIWKPLIQVASVLIVITLFFSLLPTEANAETWWERLARWTDDLFSFFYPNESKSLEDNFDFQTDNEGLQQFYDVVVELGITEPVVPMWLPEDFKLLTLINDSMGSQKMVTAAFSDGKSEVVFIITQADKVIPYKYHKDSIDIVEYEKNGIIHNIISNNERKTVVWITDNLECAFTVDCQEEILYKIIESIYSRG